MACIDSLDDLQVLYLDDNPRSFVMAPNTIHACISLTASSHTTKRLWNLNDSGKAFRAMRWGIDWLLKHIHSDVSLNKLLATAKKINDKINRFDTLLMRNSMETRLEEQLEHLDELRQSLSQCFSALKTRFENKDLDVDFEMGEDESDDE